MGNVAAIVLAAGRARRFGAAADDTKLTADLAGQPLVRHAVLAALESRLEPVLVVTGQAADKVVSALDGLPVEIVCNQAFETGLASSLKAGLAALPASTRAALVLLGDMPLVRVETLRSLVSRFDVEPTIEAVVPTYEGRHGNPVLLARALFHEISRLDGDQGARRLLAGPDRRIALCPVDDPGIEIDVDTREALDGIARP